MAAILNRVKRRMLKFIHGGCVEIEWSEHFLYRILVLLLLIGSGYCFRIRRQQSSCPDPLPEGCHCEGSRRRIRLVCSGSGLTEIPEVTFSQADDLYSFDVSRNQITGTVNFDLSIKRIRKLFLGQNGRKH